MTRFDFLYVLVSIMIAISVTEIATTWATLLKQRTVERFYWVHIAWSILVVFLMAQLWWGMWIYHDVDSWTFFQMAAIICEIILLVLAASILTPPRNGSGPVDLEVYFYDVSPLFFSLAAVLMLVLAVVNLVVAKQPLVSLENVIRAIAITVAMFGATTRSTMAHSVLVGSGFVLLLVFVLMHAVR